MSIQPSPLKKTDNTNEILEFPLQLIKACLINIRDDNTFLSPYAIQSAFNALSNSNKEFNDNLPIYFHNYFIFNQQSIESLPKELFSQENLIKNFHTQFQIRNLTDNDQRKLILNEILKDFSQRVLTSVINPSQKILEQILVEPLTLISCCSFIFQPIQIQDWEELWSLKFQSNRNLSIETEFYFTKGFFRVAFHKTFAKIEIPGQIYNGIQMKLIILLPRCSSDLVHLYANIKEYLDLPYLSAYISVCIPKISMDIDMNLLECLKNFDDLYNFERFNQQLDLSSAWSLGHFSINMTSDKTEQSSSSNCLHSIDLSPTTPWIFFANRPFVFLITYGDYYILIGHILAPKIRQETKKFFSKFKS